MSDKKVFAKTVRFLDEVQFEDAKKLAAKNHQSLNGYFLSWLDQQRELNKDFLKTNKK